MIDGPLKADGRLAAKNASKIRAALTQVTNFKSVFNRYQETHPESTDNKAQDRARARSWIMLNVGFNNDALHNAIMHSWAEAYVLGQDAAGEWIAKAEKTQKTLDDGMINWDTWKPGDRATALLVKPVGGFARYLEQSGGASYFKKFDKETIEMLGTSLADAIEAGLDSEAAALLMKNHVGSAGRALTIAITEQNRAMSFSTIQRYKEADLQKMEWHVSDPCPKCAQNSGQVIEIGGTFNSGNQQPPAHPHCRCVLLPVIPGMEEPIPGAEMAPMPVGMAHTGSEPKPAPVVEAPKPVVPGKWQKGNWSPVSKAEIREKIIDDYHRVNPSKTREQIAMYVDSGRIGKADVSLIKKGQVYINGDARVQFYSTGATLQGDIKKGVLDYVDKLQEANPVDNLILSIGSESSTKHGWAVLGGHQVWITPKTARNLQPNKGEGGGFKMPALLEVSQRNYTLAHEWGHLIDRGGKTTSAYSIQNPETKATIERLIAENPDAFRSIYSGENTKEFYAEMFAEWFTTNGTTPNQLAQAMAVTFQWQK